MGDGVLVGVMVFVGTGVFVGRRVRVGEGVRDGVMDGVVEAVNVRVAVGNGAGASPVTSNWPEIFQSLPLKIWTEYIPGNQKEGSGAQSVYP